MEYDEWVPAYQSVLDAFGFDQTADEHTRDRLATLVANADPLAAPPVPLDGVRVAIAGAADSLETDITSYQTVDAIIAASEAGHRLAAVGHPPDLIVTDLDGAPEATLSLAHAGVPTVIHAHGDNRAAIDRWVPEFPTGTVLPTTQAAPVDFVQNFGGFTDGDRAAFLADHFGAATLVFPGWTFDDPTVDAAKAEKLQWAARLLYWLERRRDDRFSILDGRRDTITLPWR